MKRQVSNESGFTLIEAMMAMAIFTVGILGVFGMQTAAIKNNLAANTITIGSTWAADQVEQLLELDYNDTDLTDTDNDGCAGLDDWPNDDFTGTNPTSGTDFPIYTVYWNVAKNCTLTNIPLNTANPTLDQRPKHLRVIVTKNSGTGEQEVAVFNYIKKNL